MERISVGIDEAAQLVGLSKYTIRAYERKGLIKATRIGKRVLIPAAELERIVAEGVQTAKKGGLTPH